MNSVLEEKLRLRTELRAIIGKHSSAEREIISKKVRERLVESDLWKTSQSVLFYSALPSEVDLGPLLKASIEQKKCYLPAFDPTTQSYVPSRVDRLEELRPGLFGVLEPASPALASANPLDLILIPGLGFDRTGGRLGRGKGFYDRLLAGLSGMRCGVCFKEQVIQEVPCESHDMLMEFLLHSNELIKCSRTVLSA